MSKKTIGLKTNETWNEVVRKIGGKRIKRISMSCCDNDSECDNDNKYNEEVFDNVILLKKSKYIALCTYRLNGRKLIDRIPIDKIIDLCFECVYPDMYAISYNELDGLFWKYIIKL